MRGRGVWWGPGSVVPVGCVQIGECWQIGWGRAGCLLGIKGVVGRVGAEGRPVGSVWLVCGGFGECDRALLSPCPSPLTLTWFPTNVACNSQCSLNIEVESSTDNVCGVLMKTGHGKLRATFLGVSYV